jgi:NAD(P)H-hydrate repair Nnr-like enzyme with NAD(P)H-hydrate epimerase domain
MLPLLVSKQIREADAYTIAHEPISSVDLMERASKAFVGWFINHFQDKNKLLRFTAAPATMAATVWPLPAYYATMVTAILM